MHGEHFRYSFTFQCLPEVDEVDDWDIFRYIGKYEITLYTCTYRAYSGGKALHETCGSCQIAMASQFPSGCTLHGTEYLYIFYIHNSLYSTRLYCIALLVSISSRDLFRTLSFSIIIFLCSKTLS